jgi:putative endonuclease
MREKTSGDKSDSGSRKRLGDEAEETAAAYLEGKGFKILARNYRYERCEIDIIAAFEYTLSVIEVKASSGDNIPPESKIDEEKIKRITRTAEAFLAESGIAMKEIRFDLIAMRKHNGYWRINHIRDAFRP